MTSKNTIVKQSIVPWTLAAEHAVHDAQEEIQRFEELIHLVV
jgi:hypothetical protein